MSKSQYLQTSNVINISCYEDGQIQTVISSLDTNNFSKWYYSNDSINWFFIDQNDTNFILNNSSYNSDSILTSVCGHFKIILVALSEHFKIILRSLWHYFKIEFKKASNKYKNKVSNELIL